MGFVFGLLFALITLLIVAWRTAQEKKGKNSSTFDWDKGEYEGTRQLSLKINEHTKFAGLNGLTTDNLGFGARINFFLNAFEYKNKFTKGKTYTGASISAVVILEGKRTGADADLSDLLNDLGDEATIVGGNVPNGSNSALNESAKPSGEVVDDLPF